MHYHPALFYNKPLSLHKIMYFIRTDWMPCITRARADPGCWLIFENHCSSDHSHPDPVSCLQENSPALFLLFEFKVLHITPIGAPPAFLPGTSFRQIHGVGILPPIHPEPPASVIIFQCYGRQVNHLFIPDTSTLICKQTILVLFYQKTKPKIKQIMCRCANFTAPLRGYGKFITTCA